jgi:hypothetical protein
MARRAADRRPAWGTPQLPCLRLSRYVQDSML